MFDITGDEIALLNDSELRTLIGRLCEAELSRRGLPVSAVTWGGDQNAKDGGLDVRVELASGAAVDGFIPRPNTGFQVKRTDIPPSAILHEMRPDGRIRPVILELAARSGSYLIVSSLGSTSDTALRNRRLAMKEAIADLATRESLFVDFYDRGRVASWLREHPGLVPWVRERIGKPFTGWHGYGGWAFSPQGVNDEYLLDEAIRIRTGTSERGDGITPGEGISRIRDLLRSPGSVVRLVGLSGVGKTRFVQALFDDRVGSQNIDPSLVLYADLSDGPEPQPLALASELFQLRKRAVLVVDNCPSDLHRKLSELCRSPESPLSAITIEFDIRDDQPEGTDVFDLQPSSTDVIEKLLNRRFASLSPVDARTITRLSEGNARVAINLASTVGVNESLAGLTDSDLFVRLFQQRQEHSESLLMAAQACSLVYSFNGTDLSSSEHGELAHLGKLVGKSADQMHSAIAELKRRDLVQQRGVWRAILPHAIANRLAALALENIPRHLIEEEIIGGPERLLVSFSRRLGFLHKSNEARSIVEQWLTQDGYLARVDQLNDLGRTLLRNVAPVLPELTLEALERAFCAQAGSVNGLRVHVPLLLSLAYDPLLFDRCIALISRVAEEQEGARGLGNSKDESFVSLFKIYLSGTHALPEQRVNVAEQLLHSGDEKKRALGDAALDAMLQTRFFSSIHEFEFGARPRDYGYHPRTRDDVKNWYKAALALVQRLVSNRETCQVVLSTLAKNFRGLWTDARMHDDLEELCSETAKIAFWPEGWVAVRETQQHDSGAFEPEVLARLAAIESSLRPRDVTQRVRSIVFSKHTHFNPDPADETKEDFAAVYHKIEETARKLGELVAEQGLVDDLAAELVTTEGHLWMFGYGLAIGSNHPLDVWNRLVTQLRGTSVIERRVDVFRGFLFGLSQKSRELTDRILDAAVDDETLAIHFPALQSVAEINTGAVERLMLSLAGGRAPIYAYRCLSGGRATEPMSGADMRRLIGEIARKPEGFGVAVEILGMRIHGEREKETAPDEDLLRAGRELVLQIPLDSRRAREDYHTGEIVKFCFVGDEGRAAAYEISCRLRETMQSRTALFFFHDDLLRGLLTIQPIATLDGLFGGHAAERIVTPLRDSFWLRHNPFHAVPESELFRWCEVNALSRYPLIAGLIGIYSSEQGSTERGWSKLALHLLERAPERIEVLKRFIQQFEPSGWTGSRAATIEANAKLLDNLGFLNDAPLQEFIAAEKARIMAFIKDEKRRELEEDREENERFE